MKYLMMLIILAASFNTLFSQAINTTNKWGGVWLNEKYARVLQETLSPFQAIQSLAENEPSAIVVNNFPKTTISLVYGMHDGVLRDVLSLDSMSSGSYHITYISSEKNTNRRKINQHEEYFLPLDTNHIQWIDSINSTAQVVQFIRVSTEAENYGEVIPQYIRKQVLDGSFEDGNKHVYTFDSTGLAVWPDKTFQFTIGIDFTFSDCDYFEVVGKRQNGYLLTYGYKWKDGKLYLFHLQDEDAEFISCAHTPFVELQPVPINAKQR